MRLRRGGGEKGDKTLFWKHHPPPPHTGIWVWRGGGDHYTPHIKHLNSRLALPSVLYLCLELNSGMGCKGFSNECSCRPQTVSAIGRPTLIPPIWGGGGEGDGYPAPPPYPLQTPNAMQLRDKHCEKQGVENILSLLHFRWSRQPIPMRTWQRGF